MDENVKAFLRSQLEAGKTHDEARREMISQGYGSNGFDTVYEELAKELGIKDTRPKPAAAAVIAAGDIAPHTTPTGPVEMPGVLAMLKYGFSVANRYSGSVLAASLLTIFFTALFYFIPEQPTFYLHGAVYAVVTIASLVVSVFVSILVSMALFYVVVNNDENPNFMHGIQWSYQNIFSLIWLGILTTAITLTGFVALVIPGLVFAAFNIFTYFVLAKDGHHGLTAIVRSTDLVMGRFWGILVRVLGVSLVFVPAVLIVTALLTFAMSILSFMPGIELIYAAIMVLVQTYITAVLVGALTLLYNARVAEKSFFDYSLYNTIRWTYVAMALLGTLIPVGLFLLAGYTTINFFNQYMADFESRINAEYELYPTNNGREVSLDDFLVESRVDTAFTSAKVRAGKLKSYEGTCQDVLVEAPAKCLAREDSLVIYAPLSDGRYYCRDSKDFKGYQDYTPANATGCQ